jgi:hypothetical protein
MLFGARRFCFARRARLALCSASVAAHQASWGAHQAQPCADGRCKGLGGPGTHGAKPDYGGRMNTDNKLEILIRV